MKVTYENDFIVFDINQGPKAIIESLNAKGDEGWFPTTSVNVAGTNIVFFMVKPTYEMPKIESDESKHLNKLWGNKGGN
tara:strand:+ start:5221 stop:5457 length:237 start_codon:yes stop_codon:yes gene_type:complete